MPRAGPGEEEGHKTPCLPPPWGMVWSAVVFPEISGGLAVKHGTSGHETECTAHPLRDAFAPALVERANWKGAVEGPTDG